MQLGTKGPRCPRGAGRQCQRRAECQAPVPSCHSPARALWLTLLPPSVTGPAGELRLQQQRPRPPAPIRRRGQELVGSAQLPTLRGSSLGGPRLSQAPHVPHRVTLCPPPGTGHAVQGKWQLWPTTKSVAQASPTTPKSEVRLCCHGREVGNQLQQPWGEQRSPGGAALGGPGCCSATPHQSWCSPGV